MMVESWIALLLMCLVLLGSWIVYCDHKYQQARYQQRLAQRRAGDRR